MRTFAAVLATALVAATAAARHPAPVAAVAPVPPSPASCGANPPNVAPIYTGTPTLVSSIANGTKWTVGPPGLSPPLTVIHVYGDAYAMGYAYGALMSAEINALIPAAFEYIYSEVNSSLASLPEPLRNWVIEGGVQLALVRGGGRLGAPSPPPRTFLACVSPFSPSPQNFTYEATKAWIPAHFTQTVMGMADATGIDWETLMRISLFPELIKASCSMLGAWGPATLNIGGGLVQLRALDWDTGGPFQQYPLVINYHPLVGDGHAFSVLTWAGLVGAVTGYSSADIGISEKVWDGFNGVENVFGYPFHFVLQDILQYDIDTDAALSRIATANRTCSIFVGIGDKFNDEFTIVGYSYPEVDIYNWRNFPAYPPAHNLFTDALFLDKHVQPSGDACLNDLVTEFYGNLSATNVFQFITAYAQTGDMHIAVYDFANRYMYVSNASPLSASGSVTPAYSMPFIRLDMNAMWNMTAPASTTSEEAAEGAVVA